MAINKYKIDWVAKNNISREKSGSIERMENAQLQCTHFPASSLSDGWSENRFGQSNMDNVCKVCWCVEFVPSAFIAFDLFKWFCRWHNTNFIFVYIEHFHHIISITNLFQYMHTTQNATLSILICDSKWTRRINGDN